VPLQPHAAPARHASPDCSAPQEGGPRPLSAVCRTGWAAARRIALGQGPRCRAPVQGARSRVAREFRSSQRVWRRGSQLGMCATGPSTLRPPCQRIRTVTHDAALAAKRRPQSAKRELVVIEVALGISGSEHPAGGQTYCCLKLAWRTIAPRLTIANVESALWSRGVRERIYCPFCTWTAAG